MEILGDIVNSDVEHDLFGTKIPHESFFTRILVREEFIKNKELAEQFITYVCQYYPEYKWQFFFPDDYLATAACECELNYFQFKKKIKFDFDLDQKTNNRIMQFGDIVTDFLIRYRNYSLIKCCGQKIILTAQSDCHKRFEEYLSKGYVLERRAKVGYIKEQESISKLGYFYKLPVLPTRDIGYPIDEIIETDLNKYEQVIQFSKKIMR